MWCGVWPPEISIESKFCKLNTRSMLNFEKQECIPGGCVRTAGFTDGGGLPPRGHATNPPV